MNAHLVDPTGSTTESNSALAPRHYGDLNGRTVGLLDSTKFNSDRILEALGELLKQSFDLKAIVTDRKPYIDRPIPIEQAKALAARCDVVITAVGD